MQHSVTLQLLLSVRCAGRIGFCCRFANWLQRTNLRSLRNTVCKAIRELTHRSIIIIIIIIIGSNTVLKVLGNFEVFPLGATGLMYQDRI